MSAGVFRERVAQALAVPWEATNDAVHDGDVRARLQRRRQVKLQSLQMPPLCLPSIFDLGTPSLPACSSSGRAAPCRGHARVGTEGRALVLGPRPFIKLAEGSLAWRHTNELEVLVSCALVAHVHP